MKRNSKPVIASVAALAITGGVLAASVGTAAAATTPTWEPDPNSLGSLTLYDASGNVVTGGTNLNHLFDYAQASTADSQGGTKATLFFASPTQGSPTGSWPTGGASASSPTPPTAAGAPAALKTSTTPVGTSGATGMNITNWSVASPSSNATGYTNVYQVRMTTSGGGGGSNNNGQYWEDDIQINPSAGTWQQIFPAVKVGTTTAVTSNDNPAVQGDSVTFTATITTGDSGSATGTVAFADSGANTISGCASQSVSNNKATCTTSLANVTSGSGDTVTATYSGDSNYNGSSGTVSQVVTKKLITTTTTLNITGNTTTGTDATLSGTVSAADSSHPAGTVSFYDNGSSTALNSSPVAVSTTDGTYSYTFSGGFAAGSHSVVAKFTPGDPTTYNGSSSQPVAFSTVQGATPGSTCTQTGSNCTDTQTIQGEIPTGTLVISTPYNDAHPLDVGTLTLSGDGTYWTGHATFQCITVTDASSGGSPFIASALANPLHQLAGTGNPSQNTSNAFTSINGENVGLTNLTQTPAGTTCPDGTTATNSYSAAVTGTDNPAANGVPPTDTGAAGLGGSAPHTVLTGTAGGEGTATYDGTLTLNAPTSTAAGTYQGHVIFTVSD